MVQGDQAARVGSAGAAIQNVLSFLDGGLLNQLQYSGNGLAVDQRCAVSGTRRDRADAVVAFADGIVGRARAGAGRRRRSRCQAPSRPHSAPLDCRRAGQQARRQRRPASSAPLISSPSASSCRSGRSSATTTRSRWTSSRSSSTPDSVLTDTIRQSTGTAVATTAFQTRALRTSSRLAGRPGVDARRSDVATTRRRTRHRRRA